MASVRPVSVFVCELWNKLIGLLFNKNKILFNLFCSDGQMCFSYNDCKPVNRNTECLIQARLTDSNFMLFSFLDSTDSVSAIIFDQLSMEEILAFLNDTTQDTGSCLVNCSNNGICYMNSAKKLGCYCNGNYTGLYCDTDIRPVAIFLNIK